MSRNIAKATGLILIINVLVKLLGFIREAVIARGFGTNWISDSYLVAYTLPYFLQSILGYALVAVSVPVLTKYRQSKDTEQLLIVGNSLINVTALILAGISLLGVLLAPVLVFLTAPNLADYATELSIQLTRIMFPSVLFMGVAMVITGILNSGYVFGWPAFAPGLSNLIIIAGVLLFPGTGVQGLAVATLLSFLGMLLVQLPSLKRNGFRYRFVCNLSHPDVQGVLRNILPIILGIAVTQINFALNRVFASGLAEGSISALNYASKLMNLPVGIFAAAVVSAIYPSLSEDAIKKDFQSLGNTLRHGLSLVCLVTVPAAIGLIVLRVPITSLLFEGNSFDAESTRITAYALLFFCIGLVPVSLNMVLTRAYYAVGDVKSPVIFGAIAILANLIASFALINVFDHGGLAFANSIAAILNTLLLYFCLLRKIPGESQGYRSFGKSFLKIILASGIMGVCVYFVMTFMDGLGGGGKTWLLIRVFVAILAGCLVYALAAVLLRIGELQEILRKLSGKLGEKHN